MVADRDTTVRVAYFFLFLFINTWRSTTRCRHCYSTLTIPPEDKIGSHDEESLLRIHLPPPQVTEQGVQDCQSPRAQSTRAGG